MLPLQASSYKNVYRGLADRSCKEQLNVHKEKPKTVHPRCRKILTSSLDVIWSEGVRRTYAALSTEHDIFLIQMLSTQTSTTATSLFILTKYPSILGLV